MNFIKPQILKWGVKYSLPLLLVLIISCNRKPEACLESNFSKANVGQVIEFTNCSKRDFDNRLEFGDEAYVNNTGKYTGHFYEKAGTYEATFTAHSKKGDKSAKSSVSVTILPPTEEQVKGSWTLYKTETYEELFVEPTKNIFQNERIDANTYSETLVIGDKEVEITQDANNHVFFESQLNWQLNGDGIIQLKNYSYRIVRISDTEMIWKGPYYKGYTLTYLKRQS